MCQKYYLTSLYVNHVKTIKKGKQRIFAICSIVKKYLKYPVTDVKMHNLKFNAKKET